MAVLLVNVLLVAVVLLTNVGQAGSQFFGRGSLRPPLQLIARHHTRQLQLREQRFQQRPAVQGQQFQGRPVFRVQRSQQRPEIQEQHPTVQEQANPRQASFESGEIFLQRDGQLAQLIRQEGHAADPSISDELLNAVSDGIMRPQASGRPAESTTTHMEGYADHPRRHGGHHHDHDDDSSDDDSSEDDSSDDDSSDDDSSDDDSSDEDSSDDDSSDDDSSDSSDDHHHKNHKKHHHKKHKKHHKKHKKHHHKKHKKHKKKKDDKNDESNVFSKIRGVNVGTTFANIQITTGANASELEPSTTTDQNNDWHTALQNFFAWPRGGGGGVPPGVAAPGNGGQATAPSSSPAPSTEAPAVATTTIEAPATNVTNETSATNPTTTPVPTAAVNGQPSPARGSRLR